MSHLAEIQAARDARKPHRRLRFNTVPVAEFLHLGDVPAEILDVKGLCKFLHIKRAAVEELLRAGLPCSDISPRAIRERSR